MTIKEAREFISALLILREGAPDELAVKAKGVYPDWAPNITYRVNTRVHHGEQLYKVWQEHTSEEGKTPDMLPALWIAINETNAGSIEDPIPAVAGMEYKKDMYYIYNDVIYLCIRQDTENGTVLHFTPDALVGQYFEVVE